MSFILNMLRKEVHDAEAEQLIDQLQERLKQIGSRCGDWLICGTCGRRSRAYLMGEGRQSQIGDECPYTTCTGTLTRWEEK